MCYQQGYGSDMQGHSVIIHRTSFTEEDDEGGLGGQFIIHLYDGGKEIKGE